jgi:ubiquinone/menaquinone biosynthesis C-methylase UbiE
VDADHWNERYATAEYVWKAAPNAFLVDHARDLPPGRALDLACGEGRNAVWLAEQGWSVTGVDFSEVGLEKARRLATERGVAAEWVCADATTWHPSGERYDLVIVFYLQLPAEERRRAIGTAAASLAPMGTLLVVAHDSRNLAEGVGGPQDAVVLYDPDEVVSDLAGSGVDVTVERAETVERPVLGSDRPALDCLVRARRISQR